MKYPLHIAIALIGLIGLYITSSVMQEADSDTNTPPSVQVNETTGKPMPSEKNSKQVIQLGYRFNVDSNVDSPAVGRIGGSNLTGLLVLKRQNQSDTWHGQIQDAKLIENGNTHLLSDSILFTAQYNNFVFSKVDLLGLEQGHPLNSVRFMLGQLSYRLQASLTIEQATGSATYSYKGKGSQVTRQLISQSQTPNQLDVKVLGQGESWQMTLRDQYPFEVSYSNLQQYQTEKGSMTVKQTMTLQHNPVDTDWQSNRFIADANGHIRFARPQAKPQKIDTYQAFLEGLQALKNNSDRALAVALGQYILENFDSNTVADLINKQDTQSNMASLLIYAIQKAGGFTAEVMLAELYQHPDMSTINKRRVLMSMGRFEGATEQTLTALKQFSDDESQTLADTALLSIGSLARFSTDRKGQVEDYLGEQLNNPQRQAMAIIAIKNSGSTKFHNKVEQLLGHQQKNVNVAAIKLLARDEKYQDKLVNHTAQSGDIQSVSALRAVLAGQGRSLTNSQKAAINQAIDKTNHPVLKKQLVALLNIEENHWD